MQALLQRGPKQVFRGTLAELRLKPWLARVAAAGVRTACRVSGIRLLDGHPQTCNIDQMAGPEWD